LISFIPTPTLTIILLKMYLQRSLTQYFIITYSLKYSLPIRSLNHKLTAVNSDNTIIGEPRIQKKCLSEKRLKIKKNFIYL